MGSSQRAKSITEIGEFEGLETAFSFRADKHDLESQTMPPNMRHEQKDMKIQMLNALKREHLKEIMPHKPLPGAAYHIISNGTFDFWTYMPALVELLGGSCQDFYGSTWTMNRNNVLSMLDLYDRGEIRSINVLTGTYFKRRESAVYATLLAGIQQRGQRFKCFENHAKIVLLSKPEAGDFISVEGSANFTANPRVEQYVITNDRNLFEFHRGWMEKYLNE
jgi:hypothetical protein